MLENRVRMTPFDTRKVPTRFYNQNIPTMFGLQFLLFFINTTEKCFGQILTTFLGSDTTRKGLQQTKLKTGSGWIRFAPEIYPQCLGHILLFRVSTTKNCFGQIFTTISGTDIIRASKLQNQTRISQFCTLNIPTLFEVQFLSFSINALINVSVEFWRLFSGLDITETGLE